MVATQRHTLLSPHPLLWDGSVNFEGPVLTLELASLFILQFGFLEGLTILWE